MHLSNEAAKKIQDALDVLLNYQSHFQKTCDDMKQIDLEITDIMHEIEFTDLDKKSSHGIIKEIKRLRQNRRITKEDQMVFNILKSFCEKNATFTDRLKEASIKMQNEISNRQHRTYSPRVRTEQMSVMYAKDQEREIAVLEEVEDEREVTTEAN